MIVGVPKEVKEEENRVAITPAGVSAFLSTVTGFPSRKMPVSGAASLTKATRQPEPRSSNRRKGCGEVWM